MKVFVTGSAGFIGYHLSERLVGDGHVVTGYDGLTDYYDPALKRARLARLRRHNGFTEIDGMLEDRDLLIASIEAFAPDVIVHLAAQAGVRYSIDHPESYVQSNLVGTANLLEAAKTARPRHLLIASTSSVYGGEPEQPFRESAAANWPVSLYAATKKANEAMAHAYAHLNDLPTTCIRFFTVYGPWGRPDMALFRFVDRIERGEEIEVFGEGQMRRDFTYVDDLVEGIVRLIEVAPERGSPAGDIDSLSPVAPWRVVNIAGGEPVALGAFIEAVEAAVGKSARQRLVPMQPGDMRETWASPDLLRLLTGYVPATPVTDGVRRFVEWYRAYRA